MKFHPLQILCGLFLLAVPFRPSPSWADPESISICDDPNQPHNAMWEKYCGGNNGGGNAQPSGPTADQIAEQQRNEQTRQDAENARAAKEKAEVEARKAKFEREKNEALRDLKGSAPVDGGWKGGDSAGEDSGLKDIHSPADDGGLKDAPNSPPKLKKKKTQKKVFQMPKGCHCGGLGCHCLYPFCGGTRKCDCAGVDCSCPVSVCKFAGTFNPCDGTVEDQDPALGNVQRCRATCGCGYPKGGCKCSVDCKCPRK